jgi:hypothetical protein
MLWISVFENLSLPATLDESLPYQISTKSVKQIYYRSIKLQICITQLKLKSVALIRKQTIPTEPPPLVGEVSVNFCG